MYRPSSRLSKLSSASWVSNAPEPWIVSSLNAVVFPLRLCLTAHQRRRCIALFAASLLLTISTGCRSVAFYGQAVGGQIGIWKRQRSIEFLLNDSATPDNLRQRLQLVLSLRAFAETNLGLPARGQYLCYADLQRPFAVWCVYGAPEFSLKAKSWWYPMVGALDYRGYFSEKAARECAARLRANGLDAHMGGVAAYSTLGWFHDPVLNTFIHDPDAELAELLFHELAHQRLFIPHDTDFNEAFATTVAQEGTRRWLASLRDTNTLPLYEQQLQQLRDFTTLVATARNQLENLYTNLPPQMNALQTTEARNRKQAILDELRSNSTSLAKTSAGTGRYSPWFRQKLNNALLNTVETYYGLVPMFQHHLVEHSRGNLSRFYHDMEALKKRSKAERRLALESEARNVVTQTAPRPLDARPAIRE